MSDADRAVIAERIESARAALSAAMTDAQTATIQAVAEGVSEVQLAGEFGVNRLTVRKWLGK